MVQQTISATQLPVARNHVHNRGWRSWFRLQRYRLTLEGWCFVLLMILVGFAAWHSGTNLLYLIFAMLIGFFLAQGVLVWLCLLGVEARRMVPAHIVAQEEVVIPVLITNTKRFLSSYALRILEYLTFSPLLGKGQLIGTGFVFRIPKNTESHGAYRAVFPSRGPVTLKHLEILTRYPFGLAERAAVFGEQDELLVYPALADVSEAVTELHAGIGEHTSNTKGAGSDLYGLKEYTPGEHTRHIHWRSSAKAQKLILIEFEKEQRQKAAVILSNYVPVAQHKSREIQAEFEKAITFTASLTKQLVEHGYEVQLITDSGMVPFGSGMNHFYRIMRSLALLHLAERGRFHRVDVDSATAIYHIAFTDSHTRPTRRGMIRFDVREWSIDHFRFIKKELAA